MEDEIIIGMVVAVVVGAHAWLFLWIKFKIDEGAVIRFLKQSKNKECGSVAEISSATTIAETRVAKICIKSKVIKKHPAEKELWGLN